MTAAVFGLLGVIVGGVLNGLIQAALARRRDHADGVVAARLVLHELELLRGDFELWLQGDRAPRVPTPSRAWQAHRAALARVLAEPEWDMVSAAYTWVELHNADPPVEQRPDPEDDFWRSVLTEMEGGMWALRDYLGGYPERQLQVLRQIGCEERKQLQANGTSLPAAIKARMRWPLSRHVHLLRPR
ncbi:MAG: hypothetical protein M3065_07305 [Actinomycetota bacterium]|nr:hypothetical protein [Actinomycetota bacterium]